MNLNVCAVMDKLSRIDTVFKVIESGISGVQSGSTESVDMVMNMIYMGEEEVKEALTLMEEIAANEQMVDVIRAVRTAGTGQS